MCEREIEGEREREGAREKERERERERGRAKCGAIRVKVQDRLPRGSPVPGQRGWWGGPTRVGWAHEAMTGRGAKRTVRSILRRLKMLCGPHSAPSTVVAWISLHEVARAAGARSNAPIALPHTAPAVHPLLSPTPLLQCTHSALLQLHRAAGPVSPRIRASDTRMAYRCKETQVIEVRRDG